MKKIITTILISLSIGSLCAALPLDLRHTPLAPINQNQEYTFNPDVGFSLENYIDQTGQVPTTWAEVNRDQFVFGYSITTANGSLVHPIITPGLHYSQEIIDAHVPPVQRGVSSFCLTRQQSDTGHPSCSFKILAPGNYHLNVVLLRKTWGFFSSLIPIRNPKERYLNLTKPDGTPYQLPIPGPMIMQSYPIHVQGIAP